MHQQPPAVSDNPLRQAAYYEDVVFRDKLDKASRQAVVRARAALESNRSAWTLLQQIKSWASDVIETIQQSLPTYVHIAQSLHSAKPVSTAYVHLTGVVWTHFQMPQSPEAIWEDDNRVFEFVFDACGHINWNEDAEVWEHGCRLPAWLKPNPRTLGQRLANFGNYSALPSNVVAQHELNEPASRALLVQLAEEFRTALLQGLTSDVTLAHAHKAAQQFVKANSGLKLQQRLGETKPQWRCRIGSIVISELRALRASMAEVQDIDAAQRNHPDYACWQARQKNKTLVDASLMKLYNSARPQIVDLASEVASLIVGSSPATVKSDYKKHRHTCLRK